MRSVLLAPSTAGGLLVPALLTLSALCARALGLGRLAGALLGGGRGRVVGHISAVRVGLLVGWVVVGVVGASSLLLRLVSGLGDVSVRLGLAGLLGGGLLLLLGGLGGLFVCRVVGLGGLLGGLLLGGLLGLLRLGLAIVHATE
jgi:hypothetical protein